MAATMTTRSSLTWCRLARHVRVSSPRVRQAEIGHDLADGGDEPVKILRLERADAADAEALRPRQLARIDDEAARCEGGIEVVEAEARVLGRHEGDDDRRLNALVEIALEAE